MDSKQTHILLHSLGLTRRNESYRNHFVTGPGSMDYENCMCLVRQGYMVRRHGNALTGGDDLFIVTEDGINIAKKFIKKPKPSEQRYLDWLNYPGSISFGEWLKRGLYKSLKESE